MSGGVDVLNSPPEQNNNNNKRTNNHLVHHHPMYDHTFVWNMILYVVADPTYCHLRKPSSLSIHSLVEPGRVALDGFLSLSEPPRLPSAVGACLQYSPTLCITLNSTHTCVSYNHIVHYHHLFQYVPGSVFPSLPSTRCAQIIV